MASIPPKSGKRGQGKRRSTDQERLTLQEDWTQFGRGRGWGGQLGSSPNQTRNSAKGVPNGKTRKRSQSEKLRKIPLELENLCLQLVSAGSFS